MDYIEIILLLNLFMIYYPIFNKDLINLLIFLKHKYYCEKKLHDIHMYMRVTIQIMSIIIRCSFKIIKNRRKYPLIYTESFVFLQPSRHS